MPAPLPRLVGMVHLGPLPGSPRFSGDMDSLIAAAVEDARRLEESGFDGVGIENFGDAPFYRDDVPKVTIAAMTRAIGAVTDAVDLPVGVNVLRNDGAGAIAIAAATGAAFVRVNVLSGSMWTDQGLIIGNAAEVVRLRGAIAPETRILADVFVKHAIAPHGATLQEAAEELAGRGLADGIIVSGTATGRPPTVATLEEVRTAVSDTPIYIGSGANVDNVAHFLAIADGVIVGTALKKNGETTNPVDPDRARTFAAAGKRALES